jgi:hypothetical protein
MWKSKVTAVLINLEHANGFELVISHATLKSFKEFTGCLVTEIYCNHLLCVSLKLVVQFVAVLS